MVRPGILMFVLWLSLLPLSSMAADITATLDRPSITQGETVQLILTSRGRVDDDPDLSVLEKDFEILGQSQQSSYQFINGKASASKQWILKLRPRHDGQIKIPSISFGKDLSPGLRLTVKQAVYDKKMTEDQDFMLQVKTDTKSSHVNAQIILTIELLYNRNFNNGQISDLNISGGGRVKTEPLGEPSRYQKIIGGTPYNVYQTRYALFPEQAGTLTIEALRFEGEVGPGYGALFDPLAGQTGKRVRLQSEAQQVEILPRPADWKSAHWLPAANLTLNEEWSDLSQSRVGVPITRTVTLKAVGQSSSQLPELLKDVPPGLKAYPDQSVLDNSVDGQGITGMRREQVAYIPEQGGEIHFPALEIHWWNTRTGNEEITELPARTVAVSGAAAPAKSPASPVIATDEKQMGVDEPLGTPAATDETDTSPWIWISLAFGLGWMITALILWRRRSHQVHGQAQVPLQIDPGQGINPYEVHKACLVRDRHQMRLEILRWAKMQWPNKTIKGFDDIGDLAGEPLQGLLQQINQQYAKDSQGAWPCDEIRAAIRALQSEASTNGGKTDALTPLYPG